MLPSAPLVGDVMERAHHTACYQESLWRVVWLHRFRPANGMTENYRALFSSTSQRCTPTWHLKSDLFIFKVVPWLKGWLQSMVGDEEFNDSSHANTTDSCAVIFLKSHRGSFRADNKGKHIVNNSLHSPAEINHFLSHQLQRKQAALWTAVSDVDTLSVWRAQQQLCIFKQVQTCSFSHKHSSPHLLIMKYCCHLTANSLTY